jgi:hypothetical protein
VISVVDPHARPMHKSVRSYRDGYKAHLAVEPETGLVTAAALTPATTPDGPTGVTLLAGEPAGLEVLADSAYGSGEVRVALRAAGHHQRIKPIPSRPAVPGGLTRDDFVIDLTKRTVTCPAGHTVTMTPPARPASPRAARGARCASAARPPSRVARSRSTPSTRSYAPPANMPTTQRSKPATGAGDRWSNAPSPGWSPTATAVCAIAE